ncbi:MAG TPA: class I SAM-dependent methyltransferase [Solirubrobacteraceae bacterium]|nr:class I SAM-dependent methyltransferase [Solirubrobacteraceae bacterium]
MTDQLVDWVAAQAEEFRTWKDSIAQSPSRLFTALASAAELDEFMRAHGITHGRSVEVGIGPLGLGWTALFGRGEPEDLVGFDPLPRIDASTGIPAVDEFVSELQQRLTYVQGRAEDGLLPSGSFDLVLCSNVIDHTERPGDVLRECRRLVTEDGRLVFGVNVFSTIGYQKWVRYSRRAHPHESNVVLHPHSYTEKIADELVGRHGWRVVARQGASRVQRVIGHSYTYHLIAKPV